MILVFFSYHVAKNCFTKTRTTRRQVEQMVNVWDNDDIVGNRNNFFDLQMQFNWNN